MKRFLRALIKSITSGGTRRPVGTSDRGVLPRLEILEERQALSGMAFTPPATASPVLLNPGVIRGFNPQPEPPGGIGKLNPGLIRGFNPQPKPPAGTGFGAPISGEIIR